MATEKSVPPPADLQGLGWAHERSHSMPKPRKRASIKKRKKLVTLMDGDAVASILVGLDRAGMYMVPVVPVGRHVPYVHIPTYRSNWPPLVLHLTGLLLPRTGTQVSL